MWLINHEMTTLQPATNFGCLTIDHLVTRRDIHDKTSGPSFIEVDTSPEYPKQLSIASMVNAHSGSILHPTRLSLSVVPTGEDILLSWSFAHSFIRVHPNVYASEARTFCPHLGLVPVLHKNHSIHTSHIRTNCKLDQKTEDLFMYSSYSVV
jgi:hypothetical protein